ncbi:MAG: sortase [Candidatus Dojkabacteria bacterium]|jgi:sortase (surface protein transpeptidase)|nr:sortase [Candidatus Dojkabacteria bacterium]MDD2270000.1 sortase [Candidatus Dojkabacteria bacterium]
MKKKQFIKNLSNVYIILGFFFLLIAFIVIAIPISPYILYRINPDLTQTEIESISMEISQSPIIPTQVNEKEDYLPVFDPSLPEDPFIKMPSIGVYSPIGDSTVPEESLKNGTWIASDYGTPEDNSFPIILAAHRFGYVYWDRETRNRVSFFNLPNTSVGDTVELTWNQRRYEYVIYDADESSYIKDYEADLILYTCKYFNSPQRIFRYATRVN